MLIAGINTSELLNQACAAAKSFQPMDEAHVATVVSNTQDAALNGKYELFKTTAHFDTTARHPDWLGSDRPAVQRLAPQLPGRCRGSRVSVFVSEASARTWARNNNVVGKPNLLLRYTTQTRVDLFQQICTIVRTSTRVLSMGLLTKNDFPSLQALYTAQLRYLSTENQILKGLADMIEHADDEQLKQAFQSHRQETEVHVSRLNQLIGDVDTDVDDKKDPTLTAIAGSGRNITKETDSGPIRDAGLIATAQKNEHYEIASYGSAHDWATHLGLTEHAATLQATLDEEKHADALLSQISQRANRDASTVAA